MTGRALHQLSSSRISTLREPGRYADGGGLYLLVDRTRKSWTFRYSWHGCRKEIGLGSARDLSLAMARDKASEFRALVARGENPKTVRDKAVKRQTFGEFADAYVETMASGWKSEKHLQQWQMTLTEYAKPLRKIDLREIDTDDVLRVLKPKWATIPETASRLRGRIERVLDAARVSGFREGENPARWRGHLDHLLPRRRKATRGHHAALPFTEIESFIKELRQREAVAARALEFLILTVNTGIKTGQAPV